MNDQPVLDAYHHTDLRKTRAAMNSIIPVDTGLALGIDRLMPQLAGRFQAQAMRVPTINVSAIDLSVLVNQAVDTATVNQALRQQLRARLKTYWVIPKSHWHPVILITTQEAVLLTLARPESVSKNW